MGSDGGIFSFGNAQFYGSLGGTSVPKPVVGMAPTVDGGGYWLTGSNGGVTTFGEAQHDGAILAGTALGGQIVGMAPSEGFSLSASPTSLTAAGGSVKLNIYPTRVCPEFS